MGYKFNFVTPDGAEVGTNSATAASDYQYVQGYKPVAAKRASSNPSPKPRVEKTVEAPESK